MHDDWGWSDPGDPSWCPRHSLFRRAARCWPSAGLLVGSQHTCRRVTPGKLGCDLPLRGHRGTGTCSRLSPAVMEAEVTPAAHLRGRAPLAASPACIVMEGSGRAGPSVVVNASRRKRHHHNTRSARPLVPERISKVVLDQSDTNVRAPEPTRHTSPSHNH